MKHQELDNAEGERGGRDGVVLSVAGMVVLGNGEEIQARRAGGEQWQGRGSD